MSINSISNPFDNCCSREHWLPKTTVALVPFIGAAVYLVATRSINESIILSTDNEEIRTLLHHAIDYKICHLVHVIALTALFITAMALSGVFTPLSIAVITIGLLAMGYIIYDLTTTCQLLNSIN
jgi:hypothetical protein